MLTPSGDFHSSVISLSLSETVISLPPLNSNGIGFGISIPLISRSVLKVGGEPLRISTGGEFFSVLLLYLSNLHSTILPPAVSMTPVYRGVLIVISFPCVGAGGEISVPTFVPFSGDGVRSET